MRIFSCLEETKIEVEMEGTTTSSGWILAKDGRGIQRKNACLAPSIQMEREASKAIRCRERRIDDKGALVRRMRSPTTERR